MEQEPDFSVPPTKAELAAQLQASIDRIKAGEGTTVVDFSQFLDDLDD
jgi:hypothetical protein